ncbi:galactoside 2-alpha-L-fucosyltransferase 2-like [Mizuhopecten yessoensis]|uniref:L-Fucosyltransferase n=1 Tax=Mizuhopecten yessoensis TaxID=6573 RepID=A0A210PP64_MIZYE|nr:galactoside 2-alpha-L-fucosyltransferase 2-like [Mizuhopecten yessoensis]XP_021378640.1 galactoside 2-alpha-L-fucosyltransferase 2-like [Mizuhopecten yessoensis]OWF38272.1 Galactoside 2-alpha-L-fucosyltransferase 2 [Mizuhopecten yessoensis]
MSTEMRLAGMRITLKSHSKCKICLGIIVVVLFVIIARWSSCIRLYWNDWNGIERPHFACMPFQGRLANQMFQYAFMYAFSRDKELVIMMSEAKESNILSSTFEIEFGLNNDYGFGLGKGDCLCFQKYEDDWDCAYDKQFEEIEKRQDSYLYGYFQSWKYWKHYENEIRSNFHFQEHVKISAQAVLQNIIQKSGSSPARGDILVGVHIRRGDYVNKAVFTEYGYTTATEQYLHKATQFFRKRYKNPTFIVCSNDFTWARTALGKFSDVYFAEGNAPDTDMALLSSTNHTIMTVGTFGWWSAFLTNGTTVYYKHPYIEGSPFSKQFHDSTTEHFYPGWIGLE